VGGRRVSLAGVLRRGSSPHQSMRYTRRVLRRGRRGPGFLLSRGQSSSARISPKSAIAGVFMGSFGGWIRRVEGGSFRTGAGRAEARSRRRRAAPRVGVWPTPVAPLLPLREREIVKRRLRLKQRKDFDRAVRGRGIFTGRALVAFAAPNGCGHWRVGIAVSRQLKGAVARNRLRRRLREAARISLLGGSYSSTSGKGYDVVLIGRLRARDLPESVLQAEAGQVRSRLRAFEGGEGGEGVKGSEGS
jgi:ribonuclease P protein component